MLQYAKKADLKARLEEEKSLVDSYKNYERDMKETISIYVKEFDNVSFDNEALKTVLLNNFDNAVMQIDNNLQDIDSLDNVLEILDSQTKVSEEDVNTYNRLYAKSIKDLTLTQNFLKKTLSCFDNVHISGSEFSISILDDCKNNILQKAPFEPEDEKEEFDDEEEMFDTEDAVNASIQKSIDYTSSDLLCFFPKTKNDNLVISTSQDSYKISFKSNVATIHIASEDFNISLTTPGVQVSSSQTNNILFITYANKKYKIITNTLIEIPSFVQVSKISKNDDFLEVQIPGNVLNLSVENNVINFEDAPQVVPEKVEKVEAPKLEIPRVEIPVQPQFQATTVAPRVQAEAIPTPTPTPTPRHMVEPPARRTVISGTIDTPRPVNNTSYSSVNTTIPYNTQEATINQAAVNTDNSAYSLAQEQNPFINTNVIQNAAISPVQTIQPIQNAAPAIETPVMQAAASPVQTVASQVAIDQPVVTNTIPNVQEQIANQYINGTPIQDPTMQGQIPVGQGIPNVQGVNPYGAPVQENIITDNDTLVISDTNRTVTLPYKVADLEAKMKKNKSYRSLQEVIDKEYTIPMETFKNPVKSRFREAFQLVKKKEHGSLKEAIGLGFELMFQSDLNPAVIAACKDLDELDIYLDCLDDNELDKFSCFKIQYNVPPTRH